MSIRWKSQKEKKKNGAHLDLSPFHKKVSVIVEETKGETEMLIGRVQTETKTRIEMKQTKMKLTVVVEEKQEILMILQMRERKI